MAMCLGINQLNNWKPGILQMLFLGGSLYFEMFVPEDIVTDHHLFYFTGGRGLAQSCSHLVL